MEQYELVVPVVRDVLVELEARGLSGVSDLSPEDWFRIDSIVSDLCLTSLARRERVLYMYFF